MASDNSQIKQHQRLARSGGDPQASGDFGVEPMASHATSRRDGEVGNAKFHRRVMKDGDRNAPVAHSKGMGQANPEHGKY
jgi:hypothetical protein